MLNLYLIILAMNGSSESNDTHGTICSIKYTK